MLELWLPLLLGLAAWGALTFVRLKRFLHILQLEEYFTGQYTRWLNANRSRYLDPALLGAGLAATIVASVLVALEVELLESAGILGWGAVGLALLAVRLRNRKPAKKPLVMTARARRLLVTGLMLAAAITALLIGVSLAAGERQAVEAGLVAGFLVGAGAGYLLALANVLLFPVEEASRRKFQKQAQARLAQHRPRIIAITGSAGKTTTKELAAHLLSARHRVLKTPSSFNTPMGISRTINDSLGDQDYFVVEMGAYKKGEIGKLCSLVGGTDISVITTVNAQHLERFGSLEKTAEAKFEIVDGLKRGGLAILNFDVPAVRDNASNYSDIEVFSFGVESEDVRLRGSNVVETTAGIELDVTYEGQTVAVKSQLVSRHNSGNILAAMAVGLACGLDLSYMAAAVRQFRAPEHRLQPMPLPGGATMLDDGYNANPEGIIGALQVLGAYHPRRRVLVTPGLIEMGNEKQTYHAAIGRAAARTVDVAILVGPKQTSDIKSAMVAEAFPEQHLHVTRSLDEARELMASLGVGGSEDVILFANDLPDQYDEDLRI